MTHGAPVTANPRPMWLVLPAIALLALSACSGPPSSAPQPKARDSGAVSPSRDPQSKARDSDAVDLEVLTIRARVRAETAEPEPVLRQIDYGWPDETYTFRFSDPAAKRGVLVVIPGPDLPPEDWEVIVPELSAFEGSSRAGLSLSSLGIGPSAVVRAAETRLGNCDYGWMLLGGSGDNLRWVIFCFRGRGAIPGTVDVRTGEYTLGN